MGSASTITLAAGGSPYHITQALGGPTGISRALVIQADPGSPARSIVIHASGVQLTWQGEGRVAWVVAQGDVTFRGLTLTGGRSPADAGAVLVESDAKARFEDCALSENAAGRNGGAVVSLGGVHFANCMLAHNEAFGKGGSVYVKVEGIVTMLDCVISDSKAFEGGGVAVEGNTNWLQYEDEARFEMAGGGITRNQATKGGGLWAFERSSASLTNASVAHNFVVLEGAFVPGNFLEPLGGAFYVYEGDLDLTNVVLLVQKAPGPRP